MLPVILDWIRLEELLANAFCSTAIITRPGTRKAEYGTAPYTRACPCITWEKMSRYRSVVSTGAAMVWKATFQKRRSSLYSSVLNPLMAVATEYGKRGTDKYPRPSLPVTGSSLLIVHHALCMICTNTSSRSGCNNSSSSIRSEEHT